MRDMATERLGAKMNRWTTRIAGELNGQSLLETALVLPLLLTIVFNAVNYGYFYFIALNLTSAPRTAALYSMQGGQTQNQLQLPSAASVQQLAVEDISGSFRPGGTAPMQVCSIVLGINNPNTASQTARCASYNGGSSTFPSNGGVDPEAPAFVAHRVDIAYTVTPLVQGRAFNIVLPSSLTFHRYAVMRAMN
jgi:Flp pilus assembly protein TadG